MTITKVYIKPSDGAERLLAYAEIEIDGCFVVHDLRLIRGANGPFVAMPDRKITDHCPGCGHKNVLAARFCNRCGGPLAANRVPYRDDAGKPKLHADVAHPIDAATRQAIERAVIQAFKAQQARASGDVFDGYRADM